MNAPAAGDIVVRPARPADLHAVETFVRPFISQKKLLPRTFDELGELLPNGFVAEAEGRLVGFATLEIYSKKLAEVRSLAVAEDVRGRGVGRRLVEACIDRAREKDILEVMVITSAEDFFRSCGFDFTLPGEKKALFLQTRDA